MRTILQSTFLQAGSNVGWYRIERTLGQGGFGITYLATDTNLEIPVAIKEYLPASLAVRDSTNSVQPITQEHEPTFRWGIDRFVKEAQTLAKFNHPNIVRVMSVFEGNNTAYMVMEFVQGRHLRQVLAVEAKNDEHHLKALMGPLIDGLSVVHSAGFIHRDIKPSNIQVRDDGVPVLIDFGSARQAVSSQSQQLTSLVTEGYAPLEQYGDQRSDEQGPWTDVYALGAVLYYAVTGEIPVSAALRASAILNDRPDPLERLGQSTLTASYSRQFLDAVDWALSFKITDRPQTLAQWSPKLLTQEACDYNGIDTAEADAERASKDSDRKQSPSLRTLQGKSKPAAVRDTDKVRSKQAASGHIRSSAIRRSNTHGRNQSRPKRAVSSTELKAYSDKPVPIVESIHRKQADTPVGSEAARRGIRSTDRRRIDRPRRAHRIRIVTLMAAAIMITAGAFLLHNQFESDGGKPERSDSSGSTPDIADQATVAENDIGQQRRRAERPTDQEESAMRPNRTIDDVDDSAAAKIPAPTLTDSDSTLEFGSAPKIGSDNNSDPAEAPVEITSDTRTIPSKSVDSEAFPQSQGTPSSVGPGVSERRVPKSGGSSKPAVSVVAKQTTAQHAPPKARTSDSARETSQRSEEKIAELVISEEVDTPIKAPITATEISAAIERFSEIRTALETGDKRRFFDLAETSDRRRAMFDYLFREFESFDVSLQNISAKRFEAKIQANLVIDRMTRNNGDLVIPSASVSKMTLETTRHDQRWGQVFLH